MARTSSSIWRMEGNTSACMGLVCEKRVYTRSAAGSAPPRLGTASLTLCWRPPGTAHRAAPAGISRSFQDCVWGDDCSVNRRCHRQYEMCHRAWWTYSFRG